MGLPWGIYFCFLSLDHYIHLCCVVFCLYCFSGGTETVLQYTREIHQNTVQNTSATHQKNSQMKNPFTSSSSLSNNLNNPNKPPSFASPIPRDHPNHLNDRGIRISESAYKQRDKERDIHPEEMEVKDRNLREKKRDNPNNPNNPSSLQGRGSGRRGNEEYDSNNILLNPPEFQSHVGSHGG